MTQRRRTDPHEYAPPFGKKTGKCVICDHPKKYKAHRKARRTWLFWRIFGH